MARNEWITDKEEILIDSPVMKFIQRDCHSSEDERKHRFYLLDSRDWANIIPVTADGNIVLVKQFRIGIDQHTLEIPGGIIDPSDKDYAAGAVREMAEETGYHPLPGAQCHFLGKTKPNPAIINNECHSFVVGPVSKQSDQNLDEGEMIETVEVPIAKIPEILTNGEMDHALILNAFFFLMTRQKEGKELITRQLQRWVQEQTPAE